MIRRICPEDPELRPLAAGEATDGAVSDHVTGCPACRQRVDRMAAAVRALRRDGAAVLTESWPEPGPCAGAPPGPAPPAPPAGPPPPRPPPPRRAPVPAPARTSPKKNVRNSERKGTPRKRRSPPKRPQRW